MKSVVRNLTGSTIVLPGSLNSFPLPAGQDKDFMYSGLSKPDVRTLVSLASGGSISFPGSVGLGIPAGLQVTPSSTYVLNGQEPADPFDGDTVYSITDGVNRTFHDGVWQSAGFDVWIRGKNDDKPHFFGVVVPLLDGRVFGAGGLQAAHPISFCEVYDPNKNQWRNAADIPASKLVPMLTAGGVLADGRVLLTGGNVTGPAGDSIKSYLYDPTTDAWTATGSLPNAGAVGAVNTLLARVTSGKMLFCPGFASPEYAGRVLQNTSLRSYLYDPTPGTWLETPQRAAGHGHERTAPFSIGDNKAFICGGTSQFAPNLGGQVGYSNKADIYNATANTWTPTADLPAVPGEDDAVAVGIKGARVEHGVIVKDRSVVVVGGYCNVTDVTSQRTAFYRQSIVVYDIDDGDWTISSQRLPVGLAGLAVFDFAPGKVMISGGYNAYEDSYKTFIYDIAADSLVPAADLPTRQQPGSQGLPDRLVPWFSQNIAQFNCVDLGAIKWSGAGTDNFNLGNSTGQNAVYLPAARLSSSLVNPTLTNDQKNLLADQRAPGFVYLDSITGG